MRKRSAGFLLAAALSLAVPTGNAHADAPADASQSAPAKLAEAQRRYARAIELFDEGNFEVALLEFRRAYELAPNYRILYNLGQVSVQLSNYNAALTYFEQYLATGQDKLPAERVAEVTKEIDRLRGRVANVQIKVSGVDDATVSIDDEVIGKVRPSPIRVNAGRRRVTVTAEGRAPMTQLVEVVGGDNREVPFVFPLLASAKSSGDAPPPRAARSVPWVGWGITGVLTAGAVVTGILATSKTSSFDTMQGQFGANAGELDSLRTQARTFAITTDILAAGAIVAGAISLYFTIKTPAELRKGQTAWSRPSSAVAW
jgi:hypothetical protein